MADTWITDLRHFLDDDGELVSFPGHSLATHLCRIVSAVTRGPGDDFPQTNVPCRRRPQRRPCPGYIVAGLEADGEQIVWSCPVCDDNGWISGWQHTQWDHRKPSEALEVRRITYRRGLLESLRERKRLPTVSFEGPAIPQRVDEALYDNDLIGVSRTVGDPDLGDPIQYDELTIEYDDDAVGPDVIIVFNRAAMLFATKDPFLVRFHRVASLVEDAASLRGQGQDVPDPEFIPPDEGVRGDRAHGGGQSKPPWPTVGKSREPLDLSERRPAQSPAPARARRSRRTDPSEKRAKVAWSGTLTGVQPRIRLTRSFDERSHTYQGFVLFVSGEVDGVDGDFAVAIGRAAQAKHGFRCGDAVEGAAWPVPDERRELAGYYKASRLRVVARDTGEPTDGPPWLRVPPDLEVYRARGHRRLAARTYSTKCGACIWACRMPVEMIIDPWNPSKRYRFETFCYGPLSCKLYAPGPTRKVPGRHGMSYEEQDWVDEDATAHRAPDE